MLQVPTTAIALPSAMPDNEKDDDPSEPSQSVIIDFEQYRNLQPSLTDIVTFPITVDESLSAEAQNIMKCSCGDSIGSLTVEPLLRKHQSVIWISMKAAAYGMALHAIIVGLPSAELGTVTHMPASLQG